MLIRQNFYLITSLKNFTIELKNYVIRFAGWLNFFLKLHGQTYLFEKTLLHFPHLSPKPDILRNFIIVFYWYFSALLRFTQYDPTISPYSERELFLSHCDFCSRHPYPLGNSNYVYSVLQYYALTPDFDFITFYKQRGNSKINHSLILFLPNLASNLPFILCGRGAWQTFAVFISVNNNQVLPSEKFTHKINYVFQNIFDTACAVSEAFS